MVDCEGKSPDQETSLKVLIWEEELSPWLSVHRWAIVTADEQTDLIEDIAPSLQCAEFCAALSLHHLTKLAVTTSPN